jgi:hypothetical protein
MYGCFGGLRNRWGPAFGPLFNLSFCLERKKERKKERKTVTKTQYFFPCLPHLNFYQSTSLHQTWYEYYAARTYPNVVIFFIFENFNPFRSYVEPRPTVWFSCFAPMPEDVRNGFVAFVRPLSEPVRRFLSCSTDFSHQIAQVVLFLFLRIFLL